MKLYEIQGVIQFPKKKQKSSVVGKADNGNLIRRCELTGIEYEDVPKDPEFWLIDTDTQQCVKIATSPEQAETDKKTLERWHKLNIEIREV